MKRGVAFAAVLGLAMLGPGASVWAETQVGMLTMVRGHVRLLGASGERPARMMGLLYDGDQVQTAADGQAMLVYFVNGRREQLGPGSQIAAGVEGSRVKEGPAPVLLAPLDARLLENLRKGVSTGLANRGGGVLLRDTSKSGVRPQLLGLIQGKTSRARPTFRWEGPPQAVRYRLVVEALDATPMWETTVQGTSVEYPAAASPLKPGETYSWQVKDQAAVGSDAAAAGEFTLLTSEEQQSLGQLKDALERLRAESPEDPAPRIALAAVYRDRELYDEAAEVLQALVEEYPHEPHLLRFLADVYEDMGSKPPE